MTFNRLTWGVKASFKAYVEAAGGSITLSEGATLAEDGAFRFAAVPGGDLAFAADGSATGAMRFSGAVTFEAHGGMLKSTLTELGIEAGPNGLVLTVLQAPMNKDRCAIAQLTPGNVNDQGIMTLGSAITFDGMYQIADNYPPGTALDPLQLD
ncbi:MAG: HtaA domain-containing protein [Gammaproteobacteria bacterium]|nr:HtaA domain-containing protein [Gammaproteobacteria bacterium]